ncbi:ribbon-helix-helix protein, CopG family [Gaopeijia maritima]|uniref:CopG family transcriptional regulator n=1 Tax=Gaopeijia maritima TaxID=3119007 RepID=A0ABU9E4I4_9BACT
MKKMTFTLDDESVIELDRAAARLGIPKSQVVREAVRRYGEQLGRLTDEERIAKLEAFDRLVPAVPTRPREDVEAELAALRDARRQGGRRSPAS